MDNSRFSKMARDTGILDDALTSTVVDLVFSRVKGPGERRIRFREFLRAVDEMARTKVRAGLCRPPPAACRAAPRFAAHLPPLS